MLEELLSEDNVSFHYPADYWEDVIRHGGQLMVDAGLVEPSYVDAMVETVHEMGHYIVLAPGVAMPHARPEAGAKRVGTALVTLDKPVNFGNPDHDPVKVAVFLCAPNKEEHMQLLSDIAMVIDEEDFLDAAVHFESIDDVRQYIKSVL